MPDGGAGGDATESPGGPTGDALWDDWDTPPRVPSAPILHLDGFDGPIDLLLDLAERQQLDLGRISMVDLVDQFVAASARLAAHVSLERRADWLVMAARLVLLRARLLFPATPEAAEGAVREAEREVAQLDGLRFVRAAAAWLQGRPQLGYDVFARPPRGPDPQIASYMALMEACLAVLRGPEAPPTEAPVYRPRFGDVFRIGGTLVRLRALVAAMTAAQPLEALLPSLPASQRDVPVVARSAVAVTFMAALELCRGAQVELEQGESFGPIIVRAIGDGIHRGPERAVS